MVIYTSVFGDYHPPYPQPKFVKGNIICFVDGPKKSRNGWEYRDINQVKGYSLQKNPTLKNRFCKLNPHLLFPNKHQSVYIDANFIILQPIDQFVKDKLSKKHFWAFNHQFSKDDGRNCIYEEAKAIEKIFNEKGILKDDLSIIKNQMQWYREQGYPKHNGLIKGGVLLRNHNTPEVKKMMEDWWSIVSTKSKRDQLSFNYVAWKNKFDFGYLDGEIRRGNPYFKMNGGHRSNYTLQYLKAIKNCWF